MESVVRIGIACLAVLLAAKAHAATLPVPLDAPAVIIKNEKITAKIYLIDPAKGFYRGQRFDQAGVVGRLTLDGTNFYGPWFDRVSREDTGYPFTPEGVVVDQASAICGPVEEFAPAGFDEAQPGETFLKIGVGRLRKPDHRDYDHARTYALVDAGKRDTIIAPSGITFVQDVAHGFRYEKTLRLLPGTSQMRIEHMLTNTGTRPLISNVYDHNFLNLGPGNGDVVVTLPYAITPDIAPNPDLARVEANRIVFMRPFEGDERVAFLISGFGDKPGDYDILTQNRKTGASVRVTGDQRLVRMYIWSIRTVMAVEPFIGIQLKPSETKRWAYTYTYKAATRSP
jgi:hypothetical protein